MPNHNSSWIEELDELQFRPKGEIQGWIESQFFRIEELDELQFRPQGEIQGWIESQFFRIFACSLH